MLDRMTQQTGPGKSWQDWLTEWIAPCDAEGPGLLSASSGLMAIAAVYLYFTGYIFSLFYFRAFGVSLDSLDFSGQYFLVQAFWVFRKPLGCLLFSTIMVIAYGFASGKIRREILLATLVAAFPALFFTSYHIARQNALDKRLNPESSIRIQFKEPAKADHPEPAAALPDPNAAPPAPTSAAVLHQLNESDPPDLHMLIETKDRIIVFNQPPNVLHTPDLPMVYVYTFLRSEIEWSVNSTN
jgi:hypothetical protein